MRDPSQLIVPTAASRLRARLFPLIGRGYGAYRAQQLARAMQSPQIIENPPEGFGRGLDERIVEYPWLLSYLTAGPGKLLDAGSILNHELLLADSRLASKKITILNLAPEEVSFSERGVTYVYGDLRHTSFADDEFDYVVCLSTLEHVGMDNTFLYTRDDSKKECAPHAYLEAVAELRRVLRSGSYCFISVPFGRGALHGWLQVFDSTMVAALIAVFQPANCEASYFRYDAARGWQRCAAEAARDAEYFDQHHASPRSGSPVAAGAVACLRLTK